MNFDDKKVLIAYYSRRGENYVNGDVKNLKKGNTEIIAEFISELTGGDIFVIDSVKEYSPDYFECINEAKEELDKEIMVELKENIDNLDDYDYIFLGYPNWWGTIPMVVATFLDSNNFEGKIIYPFCTSEGSGLGTSISFIKKYAPSATVKDSLSIHGAESSNSKDKVQIWINNL